MIRLVWLREKIKIGLLILIAGIVAFGFGFKNVNAFPAELYDHYDAKGKIIDLEVTKRETPEKYGEARFTLEILKATLKLKGSRHDEIPLIKSGDVIEAISYYKYYEYKYDQPSTISITASYYDPSGFKEGDVISVEILSDGDSILLNDPKHFNDNYYLYAIPFGIAVISIIFFAFIVRHKRKK